MRTLGSDNQHLDQRRPNSCALTTKPMHLNKNALQGAENNKSKPSTMGLMRCPRLNLMKTHPQDVEKSADTVEMQGVAAPIREVLMKALTMVGVDTTTEMKMINPADLHMG